jgi:uncharacterized protein
MTSSLNCVVLVIAATTWASSTGAAPCTAVNQLTDLELTELSLNDVFIKAFIEPTEKANIRADQVRWESTLDKCKQKRPCLMRTNRARQQLLTRKSLTMPFTGFFGGASGDLVLHPLQSSYIVKTRTVEAASTQWAYQARGIAREAAKHLRFSASDGSKDLNL